MRWPKLGDLRSAGCRIVLSGTKDLKIGTR